MTRTRGASALSAVAWNMAGGGLLLSLLVLISGCASTGGDSAPSGSLASAEVADAKPKVEPKSKYGNPKSYVVFGKRYYTKASADGHVERGMASWYGKKFHGRKTSSGERYNMHAMTAAHKTLPLPTYVRVTNVKNGRSAVVKVNDRGPFHGGRVIDLSYAAARKLGVVKHGTAMVEVRAIDPSKPGSGGAADNLFVDNESDVGSKSSAAGKDAPAIARKAAPKHSAEPAIDVVSVSPAVKATPAIRSETRTAAVDTGGKSDDVSAMYLQVGAFGSRTNAEQLRRQLVDQLAENVLVRSADGRKAPLYKVHVGPLDSRVEADGVSQKLASLGLTKSVVVVE